MHFQERLLCQKTQELDKKSRALLNVPDRKQRTQIELIKAQNEEIKREFAEKEKRYRSKIERLKKQNKKLRAEKVEVENELKKVEKERLELWNKNEQKDPMVTVKREQVNGDYHSHKESHQSQQNSHQSHRGTVIRKKKKYLISKIDANRPKTQQTMHHNPVMVKREIVHQSTNDLYDRHSARENMMNSQSMNQMEIHQNLHNPYGDIECDTSSSSEDDSSSSDESTKNAEDMQAPEVVIISTRNGQKRRQKSLSQNVKIAHCEEQKEREKVIESNHLPEVPPEFDPSKMTAQQYESQSVTNAQNPARRMQHPDGKVEQIYGDGSKLILFPNGTEKYIFGNLNFKKHKQIFVKFPNGDIKKILGDGSEVYFYAANNIIHATKSDGIELFYFESQHEIHFADNTKHILFADGTKKTIYPNGEEQCVFPDQ